MFPTDDGWPYPDLPGELEVPFDDDIDLDALYLRGGTSAYTSLTPAELEAVALRYGLDCDACTMKELSRRLGCSHAEAREILGGALDKLRNVLSA